MVSPEEWAIIIGILRECLGSSPVFVFGSRVTSHPKKFSDLDLLIQDHASVTPHTMAVLAEKFSESDLPYKVDLVLESEISEEFKKMIQENSLQIYP